MSVSYSDMELLLFGDEANRRFTQDSPILPDVWFEFAKRPAGRLDLLLTPFKDNSPASLYAELAENGVETLAYNQSTVVAELSLDEVVTKLMPLTRWWRDAAPKTGDWRELVDRWKSTPVRLRHERHGDEAEYDDRAEALWFARCVGFLVKNKEREVPIAEFQRINEPDESVRELDEFHPDLLDAFWSVVRNVKKPVDSPLLHIINLNRPAATCVWVSHKSVKADAARTLFGTTCRHLRWAIIDKGIDARHPAFECLEPDAKPEEYGKISTGKTVIKSRVLESYDFTRLRRLMNIGDEDGLREIVGRNLSNAAFKDLWEKWRRFEEDLRLKRDIDWKVTAPLLRIPNEFYDDYYPLKVHGTHVAGALGASYTDSDGVDVQGVCPDIRLYDLRVFDDQGRGADEFSVLSALQFVRHLNGNSQVKAVHGANVSLAIPHHVANYACGRTPVCDECRRLVNAGVVVVAAAGNRGYLGKPESGDGEYRSISITDPGNAEDVITVGATHREQPHTYGVSYFSSRGPTGDGRLKPDLVAPGEKITSAAYRKGHERRDGTSMAAPHVSGAAALLMARHAELIGEPRRIKEILCNTATDLGREPYFQGHGLVDILRALQSV